jgi:hypothetical protein
MKSLSVKLGVILIGLAIFTYAEVWAADWKLIDEYKTSNLSASDSYYYIDMKSIKRVSVEKVRFWTLTVFLKAGSDKPSIEDARKRGYTDYIELDCSKKRYRSVKSESEAREGYVLIEPIHWLNIEPDSIEEKMAEVVCRKK